MIQHPRGRARSRKSLTFILAPALSDRAPPHSVGIDLRRDHASGHGMSIAFSGLGFGLGAKGLGVCAHFTERTNETFATGLYPDRTDDRGGDRRYPGGHRAAGVSGLCDSVEDV